MPRITRGRRLTDFPEPREEPGRGPVSLARQDADRLQRQEEFAQLRARDLKVCRAWAIKENLRHLWDYHYQAHMRSFFNRWYFWATHSRLKPIQKAAKTVKNHIENILTYAKHRITNALGEAINAKIEKVKRMACGFRNRAHYRTAIYFHCGGLSLFPKPPALPSLCFKSLASQPVGGTH